MSAFRLSSRRLLILAALTILCASCAPSFVVNTEADDPDLSLSDGVCKTAGNECSLRAAIQQAVSTNQGARITFDGVNTIAITKPLPDLDASNGNINIQGGGHVTLDGGNGGCTGEIYTGFWIRNSSFNIISGLTIQNFSSGIRIDGSNAEARQNIVGVNPNSTDSPGVQRNVITGNCTGIFIYGSNAFNNTVAGNLVGLDANDNALPNNNGIVINSNAHDNLIGAAVSTGTNPVNTTQMEAYWRFDESAGDAADAFGGNTLTNHNSAPYVAGKIGNGTDLATSSNQYFSAADNPSLSLGADTDFTYTLWFKPETSTVNQVLLSKNDPGTVENGVVLYFRPANNFRFFLGNGASKATVDSSGTVADGQWGMVAIWHDSAANQIGISVNGGPAVTAAWNGGTFDNASDFNIGRRVDTAGNYVDGIVDEVAFWKRTLSAQEISDLYNNGNGQVFAVQNPGRNVISGNSSAGVYLGIGATNNQISGNFIGMAVSGMSAVPNGYGVTFSQANANTVGIKANGDGSGNVISGNLGYGLAFSSGSNNVVAGNFIGTNALGLQAVPNLGQGIDIVAGTGNRIGTNGDGQNDAAERNVVSGNGSAGYYYGISVSDDNNVIAGNFIGTDLTGSAAVGNFNGIWVLGNNNRIGTDGNGTGDEAEGNVISGNTFRGMYVDGDQNTIAGNLVGTDATGMAPLGNLQAGIWLGFNGQNNVVGTNGDGQGDAAEGNLISANGIGIQNSSGVDIKGSNNVVAGNRIGTNAAGTAALGNGWYGVSVSGSNNRIGTNGDNSSDALEMNLISGNGASGVVIDGANNKVAGNYIGTDATGMAALPNGSANNSAAVLLASSASNNFIGTNGNGAGDLAERNVISGNAFAGIQIMQSGTSNNVVAGNYIGINASGNAALPNALGILINQGASNNRIGTDGNGTSDVEERNVISGNLSDGITVIVASSNKIAGNYIGTDSSGANPLGNGRYGVNLDASNLGGTDGNEIGGSPARANVIAFNSWSGVRLGGFDMYPQSSPILFNSIFSNGDNGEVGINLQPGDTYYGITPNDPGDVDSGANGLINFPELSSALVINNNLAISGDIVNGLPNASMQIQFFAVEQCDSPSQHGEGQIYLGSTTQMTDGSGNLGFLANIAQAVTPGWYITATATNNNNTSEFSQCIEVVTGTTLSLDTVSIVPEQDVNCRYYCTSASDIADTLRKGVAYQPLGWDPQTGFLLFAGPTYGESCYAPPVAGGNTLMTIFAGNQALAPDQLSSTSLEKITCTPYQPTPTEDIDESYDTTPTPNVPQCSDGVDNDGDGRIDYNPAGRGDAQCRSASDNDEAR